MSSDMCFVGKLLWLWLLIRFQARFYVRIKYGLRIWNPDSIRIRNCFRSGLATIVVISASIWTHWWDKYSVTFRFLQFWIIFEDKLPKMIEVYNFLTLVRIHKFKFKEWCCPTNFKLIKLYLILSGQLSSLITIQILGVFWQKVSRLKFRHKMRVLYANFWKKIL